MAERERDIESGEALLAFLVLLGGERTIGRMVVGVKTDRRGEDERARQGKK